MQTPATEIDQMIVQLNEFILPSSLMESFDVYREESVKRAARCFNDAQLSWLLDMLTRFRGPDDRKDSLVDIFDPGMYTCDHPAWEAAPGTRIEMPALTSEVARLVDRNSEFAEIATEEILRLSFGNFPPSSPPLFIPAPTPVPPSPIPTPLPIHHSRPAPHVITGTPFPTRRGTSRSRKEETRRQEGRSE